MRSRDARNMCGMENLMNDMLENGLGKGFEFYQSR